MGTFVSGPSLESECAIEKVDVSESSFAKQIHTSCCGESTGSHPGLRYFSRPPFAFFSPRGPRLLALPSGHSSSADYRRPCPPGSKRKWLQAGPGEGDPKRLAICREAGFSGVKNAVLFN